MSTAHNHAVVVGGGLAGTTASLDLAARGWDVTLLEARPRLGGAAYSFPRGDLVVDTGQHVLLRCYSSYRALLDTLGAGNAVRMQDRMDIPVLRPGARPGRLRRGRLRPAPLHLLPALAGYQALSWADRVAATRAAAALRRVDPDDPAADDISFGTWLRGHGQHERVLTALWGLVTIAALNLEVRQASLALAARVFRTGLLDTVDAGDVGLLAAPLSHLHDRCARRMLAHRAVRCRTREHVSAIDLDGGSLVVRTRAGETAADAVVVAVPHQQASRIVPAAARPDRDRWAALGSSAIVNVHVHYDRRVTDRRFGAVLGSPVPWFFDRTEVAGGDGQYLVVSVSAADRLLSRSSADLVDEHLHALGELFPAARSARVLDSFVTREPTATFRQRAGSAQHRPAPTTRTANLALAGAWTATGWPDTLEGAVRSGHTAASLIGTPDRHLDRRLMTL